MGFERLKPYWKSLLSSDNKDRVFDELDANILTYRPARQEYVLLRGRYEDLRKMGRQGLVSPDDFEAKKNVIVRDLLEFIDILADGDVKGEEFSKSDFFVYEIRRIIEQHIRIEEDLGLVHLVNCNREQPKESFWDAFDMKMDRGLPFHFYFVTGDAYQMPHSFSERMVYEIIHSELEEEDTAIHLVLEQDSGRVRIEDLPQGRRLHHSKREFKKYFSRRFSFQRDTDFDHYIETGLPELEYRYVTFVFQTGERSWGKDTSEYIEWLVETFSKPNNDVEMPIFIFFFVIRTQHLEKGIVEEIRQLTKKHHKATSLPTLTPVQEEDLKEWLHDLGEHSPSNQKILLDAFLKSIPQSDTRRINQYQQSQLLDMDDIQKLQKIIYDSYMENEA